MFTPARIAATVGVATTAFIGIANSHLGWLAIAIFASISAVAQTVQAFTGPVQNTAAQNAIAIAAVASVKDVDGGK